MSENGVVEWVMSPRMYDFLQWLKSPAGKAQMKFRRRMWRRAYRADQRRRCHR